MKPEPLRATAADLSLSACVECHDPFWPRVELSELRDWLQLDTSISPVRLLLAARRAAASSALEFAQWRRVLRERGVRRLDDLGRHAAGRALAHCYLCHLIGATRQALRGASDRQEVRHG